MGHRNDYRVSTLIVLCKDCGQDVGLYPARHQCTSNKRPQLPTLCSSTTSSFTSWNQEEESNTAVPELVATTTPTVTRQASDSSMESGKWSFFRSDVKKQQPSKPKEESVYFDTYASNLKNSTSLTDINDSTTSSNGKRLWGKMKENEKWKELIAEKKEDKTSSKLWKRIIDATLSNSSNDDQAAESDDDDWEGETHVSRILREYHWKNKQLNNTPLPTWLYDDRTPISALAMIPTTEQLSQEQTISRKKSSRTRRLWQTSDELSSREKEIQALRDSSNTTDYFSSKPSVLRSHSERAQNHNAPSLRQRTSYNTTPELDQVFGSFAPRRNTTIRAPSSYRNIIHTSPSSTRSSRQQDSNYF